MVAVNHEAIRAYRAAAEHARDCLRSTFGDSQQGRDADPVNLAGAAQAVENSIEGRTTHDAMHGVVAPAFLRAISQLTWWRDKGKHLVDATARACALFDAAEAKLKQTLANVTPADTVAPAPAKGMLPKLDTPPSPINASSYVDWDPREHNTKPKNDGPKIEVVGDGDGFRVGGR
jgi:hypothetical protein